MNTMDMLQELEAVRGRRRELAFRKLELERGVRASSAQTCGRARRLLADATLTLLGRTDQITRETLKAEIDRNANARDRFAVALCHDWLDGCFAPRWRDEPRLARKRHEGVNPLVRGEWAHLRYGVDSESMSKQRRATNRAA